MLLEGYFFLFPLFLIPVKYFRAPFVYTNMESMARIQLTTPGYKPADVNRMSITEIIKSYGKSLQGFIRRRVNNSDDADDILQDVYYQLAEADPVINPLENVAAWLFTVARNRITDLSRKKRPGLLKEMLEDDDVLYEMAELLVEESTPETEYLKALIWETLEEALNELPADQRYVFEMNEFKGISFKELSASTGESVSTLISRKHYAVIYLRQRLRNLYNELLND